MAVYTYPIYRHGWKTGTVIVPVAETAHTEELFGSFTVVKAGWGYILKSWTELRLDWLEVGDYPPPFIRFTTAILIDWKSVNNALMIAQNHPEAWLRVDLG